jgi:hypothetical protein
LQFEYSTQEAKAMPKDMWGLMTAQGGEAITANLLQHKGGK